MTRRVALGIIPLVALVVGCSEAIPPLSPDADASALAPAFAVGGGKQILMLDACDPASFNEAFGFEVCTPVQPRAGIKFATFISLLEKHQRVEAWRFAPDRIHVTRPTDFVVPNLGGIPHSFTEVAQFGGGFVQLLNDLSGNPIPVPECIHPTIPGAPNPNVALILPGDHDQVTIQPGGGKKYMCCIHPWMRAETK